MNIPWHWKREIYPTNRQTFSRLHGVKYQKTVIFIVLFVTVYTFTETIDLLRVAWSAGWRIIELCVLWRMECCVWFFALLYWVRETDGLQCNRCTGRTAPGRWPAAPWSSRCLLRETGFTLRAFVSGTARPGSASTARQSEELRLRQVSTLQHLQRPADH